MNIARRKSIWGALAVLGVVLAVSTPVAGWIVAMSDPIVRPAEVGLPDWPEGVRPVRVALLSDIHLGDAVMTPDRLARIIDQVNAERPDLVVMAGDFVNGHAPGESADDAAGLTEPLARLRARLGAVAVLGNHDQGTSPGAVRRALTRAGVTVLENEAVQRGPVTIVGIGDIFSGNDRPQQALRAAADLHGPQIAVTHSPDVVTQLPARVRLLLAGHTHCGQVVLPVIGPVMRRGPRQEWRPLYSPRYRCGVIRDPGRTVVVTAGLGAGSAPIRIGAPPDLWIIEVGEARRHSSPQRRRASSHMGAEFKRFPPPAGREG